MSYLRSAQESWLQKQSRLILSILAGLGTVLTAYLTVSKILETHVAFCGTAGGCDLVLSSKWATLLGIPTAAFGLVAFLAVLVLVNLPNSIPLVKQWRWQGLFALVTGMAAFELYMVYLMVFELQQFCFYCATSIVLVTGLWFTTLWGHKWVDQGQLLFAGVLIALFSLVSTHGLYASQGPSSSPLATRVALHLQEIKGTMYGAHWCPHCKEQKELFGPAFAQIPYVECSPNGGPETPRAPICDEKQITSYPTWIINGITYRGVKPLSELARISGLSTTP